MGLARNGLPAILRERSTTTLVIAVVLLAGAGCAVSPQPPDGQTTQFTSGILAVPCSELTPCLDPGTTLPVGAMAAYVAGRVATYYGHFVRGVFGRINGIHALYESRLTDLGIDSCVTMAAFPVGTRLLRGAESLVVEDAGPAMRTIPAGFEDDGGAMQRRFVFRVSNVPRAEFQIRCDLDRRTLYGKVLGSAPEIMEVWLQANGTTQLAAYAYDAPTGGHATGHYLGATNANVFEFSLVVRDLVVAGDAQPANGSVAAGIFGSTADVTYVRSADTVELLDIALAGYDADGILAVNLDRHYCYQNLPGGLITSSGSLCFGYYSGPTSRDVPVRNGGRWRVADQGGAIPGIP